MIKSFIAGKETHNNANSLGQVKASLILLSQKRATLTCR